MKYTQQHTSCAILDTFKAFGIPQASVLVIGETADLLPSGSACCCTQQADGEINLLEAATTEAAAAPSSAPAQLVPLPGLPDSGGAQLPAPEQDAALAASPSSAAPQAYLFVHLATHMH